MNWIKEKLIKALIAPTVKKLVDLLRYKKTYLGLFQIVLGLLLIAVKVVPELHGVAPILLFIVNLLGDHGLDLADALLISGQGFTVVGLIDKIQRWFKGKKEEKEARSKMLQMNDDEPSYFV